MKNSRKIIGSTFIVVSLIILLFCNWILSYGDTKFDWSGNNFYVDNAIDEMEILLGGGDESFDLSGLRSAAHIISDGKIKASEMVRIGTFVIRRSDDLKNNIADNDDERRIIDFITLLCITYIVCFGCALISAVFKLVRRLRGETDNVFGLLFWANTVLVVLSLILCIILKHEFSLQFRISLASLLCVALTVPMSVLDKLFGKLTIPQKVQSVKKITLRKESVLSGARSMMGKIKHEVGNINIGTWECVCGHKNKMSNLYCSECGERRPTEKVCPVCGKVLAPGANYCGKCGRAIETPESVKLYCNTCGSDVERGSAYCSKCGSKLF